MGRRLADRLIRPFGSPALELYARISPEADRQLLGRPEFKAMFLDDLLNGSRKQLAAPFADIVVFARDWGFRLGRGQGPGSLVARRRRPHRARSPTVSTSVARLADAELYTLPGESHLAGLGAAEEILTKVLEVWDAAEG